MNYVLDQLEQELNLNRIRRAGVNNFRLTCKVGMETGVLPESAVKEALEGGGDEAISGNGL